MAECIIVLRMPRGHVLAIAEDDPHSDRIALFPNEAAAEALASKHHLLRVMPYQIVELEI